MKIQIAWGLIVGLTVSIQAQLPQSITLKAKIRDLRECNDNDTCGISNPVNTQPDFEHFKTCMDTGYVEKTIGTAGDLGDTAVFPMDNRTPVKNSKLNSSTGISCFTSITRFGQWYNDRTGASGTAQDINRPFLIDLTFTPNAAGNSYVFDRTKTNPVSQNQQFIPLDSDQTAAYNRRALPNGNANSFGYLQSAPDKDPAFNHVFGFTLEFHAYFTYLKGTGQVFNFSGDDDVWVFINGTLAIDLGGLHTEQNAGVDLDASAAALGLVNNGAYILDFFEAERHSTGSNSKITTSLALRSTPQVGSPVANPTNPSGGPVVFTSPNQTVTLSDSTPGAVIWYTTDGSAPDTSSPQTHLYAGPIALTATTTLKAIATKAGYTPSGVLTQVYTQQFAGISSLEILDQNGKPFAVGYLSELNPAYEIRLTTQAGLDTVVFSALTSVSRDNESAIRATSPTQANGTQVFAAPIVFHAGSTAKNGNGQTEASDYDTLTVSWQDPLNATDHPSVKMPVRPSPRQSTAAFSANSTGSPTTTTFAGTESRIYFVVRDEPLPPNQSMTAKITTVPSPDAEAHSPDTLIVTLNCVKGTCLGVIPTQIGSPANTANSTLEVWGGDQVVGVYVDPLDGDHADNTAKFGNAAPVLHGILNVDRLLAVPKGVPVLTPISDPIVIRGGVSSVVRFTKDSATVTGGTCVHNCDPNVLANADPTHTPAFVFKVLSPFSYTAIIYDHLGVFVNKSTGTVADDAKWKSLPRKGDTVTVMMNIIPVASDGQLYGTGVYIIKATIATQGETDPVTHSRITAVTTKFINRFGYLRP